MEMRWQINGKPLAKIKLFFYIDRHKLAGYFCHIDFTHHICAVVVHVFFGVFHSFVFHAFIISLGNATIEHAQQNTTKKCEKEILMKFMTSNRIQLCNAMQLLYMHCIHTTLISISMTMQLANSAILTVRSVLSASVFWFALFSFSLWNVSRCSQAAVIIFDNFSDKKITRDKLLQLIEY